MKTSLYTSIYELHNGFTLIYNSLSDKFLLAPSNFIITSGSCLSSPNGTTLHQLKEINAIIDDGIDEVSQLKQTINSVDNDESVYHIHINPTLNCNFNCWYCYERHQAGSRMSDQTISAIFSHINLKVAKNHNLKTVILSFFGGEPLLYFDIIQSIITEVNQICTNKHIKLIVHFTTNGFLISDKLLALLGNITTNFQITLDGGKDHHNATRNTTTGVDSFNTIIQNIKRLALNGKNVLVRINYTSENVQSIRSIIEIFSEWSTDILNYITVDFQRVWQDKPTMPEHKMIETISSYQQALSLAKITSTVQVISNGVKDSCYGDHRNHILVNYDEDIYFCTARDFSKNNSSGHLNNDGSITWKDNALEKRMNNKFVRKICYNCKIAPLCGGGCRQIATEKEYIDGCLYNYSDENIKELVLNRFETEFMNGSKLFQKKCFNNSN